MTEDEIRQYGMRCALLARAEPELPMESVAFQASLTDRVGPLPPTLREETARLIAERVSKVFYDNPSPAAREVMDAIVRESIDAEDQLRVAERAVLNYLDDLWLSVVSGDLVKLRETLRIARERAKW